MLFVLIIQIVWMYEVIGNNYPAIFYGDYDAVGCKEAANPNGKWFASSFVQADMPTDEDHKIVAGLGQNDGKSERPRRVE